MALQLANKYTYQQVNASGKKTTRHGHFGTMFYKRILQRWIAINEWQEVKTMETKQAVSSILQILSFSLAQYHKLDDIQNLHINNRVHQHSRKIQQYANSFKYLSRHNIQPFNKIIVQNLDDYIKRQLYHIRLLISNYTLNTKFDTLLECITNNISLYISTDGARK